MDQPIDHVALEIEQELARLSVSELRRLSYQETNTYKLKLIFDELERRG